MFVISLDFRYSRDILNPEELQAKQVSFFLLNVIDIYKEKPFVTEEYGTQICDHYTSMHTSLLV